VTSQHHSLLKSLSHPSGLNIREKRNRQIEEKERNGETIKYKHAKGAFSHHINEQLLLHDTWKLIRKR
jgi:hypothetical protein